MIIKIKIILSPAEVPISVQQKFTDFKTVPKTRYFCMHQLYNVLIYTWIALDPKGSIYGAPKKILIYEETALHATMKFFMKLEENISV